jgi:hypothetical protein
MGVSRYLHTAFYVLFLICLAVALWFLLYFAKVPGWVWIFFGVAILIFIIGILLKEYVLRQTRDAVGNVVPSGYHTFWVVLYSIFHVMAFILIIVGIVFTIKYSIIPWWVWVVLAMAIFFVVLSNMFYYYFTSTVLGIVMSVLAALTFIAALVLIVIYSKSPWWVWLIMGVAVLFAFLAGIFEPLSNPNVYILSVEPEPELVPMRVDLNQSVKSTNRIGIVTEDVIYKM